MFFVHMKRLFYICAGGFVGTGMRYMISGFSHRLFNTEFPIGTFVVNFIGAFILGAFMEYAVGRSYMSDTVRLIVSIGLLGGFTTFSSFSYETIALIRSGNIYYGLLNIILTNSFCLIGVFMGMKLTTYLSKGI